MATRKQGMIECVIGAVVGTVLAMGLCLALGGCGQAESSASPDGGGEGCPGFFEEAYADCVAACEVAREWYAECGMAGAFADVDLCVEDMWAVLIAPNVCAQATRCYGELDARYCPYAEAEDRENLPYLASPYATWINRSTGVPDWFSDAYRDLGGEGPAQCGKE